MGLEILDVVCSANLCIWMVSVSSRSTEGLDIDSLVQSPPLGRDEALFHVIRDRPHDSDPDKGETGTTTSPILLH